MSKTEFEGALVRTIAAHAVAQHNTGDKSALERAEAAEQERDESEGAFKVWRRRCDEADRVLDDIGQWTREFGARLCPPGADTYGEGVRDCKQQVADILHKVWHDN
jgi:hypothetical protein